MSWKKISSKIIHENPWYIFREDDVLLPNGKEGKYYYIDEHHGIAVIAESEDGDIYIVGQNRYPIGDKYSWEIIAGGIEKGENFLVAAKRELEEEAGFQAQEWIEIGRIYPANFCSSECDIIYLARDLKKVSDNQDETENITVKKISVEDFGNMIQNGTVTCGFSIACFYKYLLHKEK